MQRYLSSWCIWSALGAVALKVLFVLLLINCFQASEVASTLTQSYWGPGNSPLVEASRLSQVLADQCAQQTRQACTVARSSFFSSLPQRHDRRLWIIPTLLVLSILLVFSRKLSPPSHSTDDDPFLR
jgi:hypothetical protein